MLRDALLPAPLARSREPSFRRVERPARYLAARWTLEVLGKVVTALREGAAALREIPPEDLLAAWGDTVATFLRPSSLERRSLDPPLARLCGLSREGLKAGLEAVLGGVRREPAAALLARARPAPADAGPVLAVLASNLPALAVQPLLPTLLVRRPVLLKSPSAEPLFAPAFLAALVRREPRLANAVAAAAWPGGEEELEEPVLKGVGTVLAYGEREALDDLERRAPGKVIGYGPQTSLAVIGAEVDPREAAEGLARDIALFDQRGCLSVAAVYAA
ncbi:MAG TPA: acyl-CoA reductase, partial [Thermoanaerobaculia bacterium]